MLCHGQPCAREDKRRRGGNIERVGPIPARPACIDDQGISNGDADGFGTHRPHGAGNFLDGFSLQTESHQVGRNLSRSRCTFHDLEHHRFGFLFGERGTVGECGNRVFDHGSETRLACLQFKEVTEEVFPAMVRIDSG